MRKKRTILWLSLLLLVLAGIGWGWYLYDKPHRSAAGVSPDLTITADSLYHQYQTDERFADQRFMGKVLRVSGHLAEIQHSGKAEIWILTAETGAPGGINCQLFAGTVIDHEPKPGDAVILKGRCTGFLMDVNLTDCVPDKPDN
jgi:hypothetical protein